MANLATQPVGVPGLSIWSGVLGEEYLTSLKGTRKAKVFREMQDDAVIGCLLDSMWMPLLAAEFETTPAGESEADQASAEFLEQCMNDMTRYSWRQHVLDKLSFLVWGWSVEEVVFKKREGQSGERPSQYSDGKLGLHILDPRGQETLDHWDMDEEFNVKGMIQRDPNSGKLIPIESWKLLHSTFRSRKRSPEGSSPLRSLYRAWYTRKNLEVIEAIGAERDVCGLPVIYLPYGSTSDDKDAAELLVRNIRQDEEAGIVIPAPPSPENGENGKWKIELLSSPGSKQFNVREIITDLNKIILMRFFAQFLLLGMDKVGTQALVEGQQDFFSLCLKSVQQELLETWNQQLVPLIFKMNPGMLAGGSGYPMVDWADPGSKDLQKMVQLVQQLVTAQVLTPDSSLEDYLRALVGLPDRPEGLGEGPRTVTPPGVPPLNELMSYDWHQLSDGGWRIQPKAASKFSLPKVTPEVIGKAQGKDVVQVKCPYCASEVVTPGKGNQWSCPKCGSVWENDYGQPDPGDVHIPTGLKKRRRDHCMTCDNPPTVDVLWGARPQLFRAWFCDRCWDEWVAESETHFVHHTREVEKSVTELFDNTEYEEAASYAEIAGIKGRKAKTKIGRATNEYQGLLTHIYDTWGKETQQVLVSAEASGAKKEELTKLLDKQMLVLSHRLKDAGKKHLAEAVRLGLKGKDVGKKATKLIDAEVARNSGFLDESLLPRIREKIASHLKDSFSRHDFALDDVGLLGVILSSRSEPAGYAGAFWGTLFKAAGLRVTSEDEIRHAPRRVKWVLDAAAEHCEASTFHHGCPDLAGEYDSWDDMPTVPAGDVSCLGNCRCQVAIQNDDGSWDNVA